jgi:hypothetical protein
MRWLLRPSEVRSRYSCTTYLASGKCKTSSIPLSPPTAADFLATGPTAPNTPPSADNTLLNRSSRTVRLLDFTPFPLLRIPSPARRVSRLDAHLWALAVESLCSLSHEDRNDCSGDERQRSYQGYGPANIVIEYCGITCANGFGGRKRET